MGETGNGPSRNNPTSKEMDMKATTLAKFLDGRPLTDSERDAFQRDFRRDVMGGKDSVWTTHGLLEYKEIDGVGCVRLVHTPREREAG